MCKFKSAIVTKTGEIYHSSFTDSHEDLVKIYNIRDGITEFMAQNLVRIEFTPPNDLSLISNLKEWSLIVDEDNTPDWFDNGAVRTKMENVISRMILKDQKIKMICGEAKILTNSSVDEILYSNITLSVNSNIEKVLENSNIGALRGNSSIGALRGNSRIGELRENSQVGSIFENSSVGSLFEYSKIFELNENSRIGELCGYSQVGSLWGNSRIDALRGNSQVGELFEKSSVGKR
jgi:hypothetical protein